MKKIVLLLMIAVAATACKTDPKETESMSEEEVQQKADSLAQALIITDGHVDLPYWLKGRGIDKITPENGSLVIDAGEGDFDYERAKQGGLDAPFMSIYIPARLQETGGAKALADSLIDLVGSMTTTYPDKFALVGSPSEVQENFRAGKISLPMGMENGAPIGTELENVNYFFERGIRYITLTHSKDNQISDSSYDTTATHQGLSDFGRLVVREMNKTGIMVDVSHISDNAFYDVMEETKVPVIASHSSCRHFTPGFERNMSDSLIKRLAENKGVIQINFGSNFLDEASQKSRDENQEKLKKLLEEKELSYDDEAAKPIIKEFNTKNPYIYADVEKVADHIDHVVNLVGIDYVGLGSDYDGVGDTLPEGLKDVSQFPNLIAELIRRGYSDEDIARICHKNVFRVWTTVLDYAKSNSGQY
ncbi:membrane dipeptidase [Psychroflexus sp. YR1-1]|uniref:Membrane dipeptidase n=1 Tax=Psychroflexus aurantiacus TaxID=2709310 RepID=A0A6B3R586_9FLAO|nr:dipeptidase [Psychroflexus aurantiacus]NEV94720.1 membrane dipeptidase [Psychroflexus aurantiacus]